MPRREAALEVLQRERRGRGRSDAGGRLRVPALQQVEQDDAPEVAGGEHRWPAAADPERRTRRRRVAGVHFEEGVEHLRQQGLITYETALENASNPDDFKLKVQGIASTGDAAREQMEQAGFSAGRI